MAQQTHQLVNAPKISVPQLADYMAASEQVRRSIVRDCKYRRIARIVQHKEARAVISNHLRNGGETSELIAKATQIETKLSDDDFGKSLNEYNADYIRQFAKVCEKLALPDAEIYPANGSSSFVVDGVKVTYTPLLLLSRLTKTNKLKIGAIMLRYARGKPLANEAALNQSAAIFGFTKKVEEEQAAEADKTLCLTIDAYSGIAHEAPGKAVYMFNQMKAACATIAERWPNIAPPPKAVF